VIESRTALHKKIERRLALVPIVPLFAGFLLSAGVILAFAKVADEVVEGETRRFDEAALLWINASLPGWLDEPMRAATALGYYWVVIPLLAVAAYAFYRTGRRISAALLVVSTTGGIVLTTALKAVFGRDRPDLFESG
jgi:undecaprenyl-diphosphatase